MKPLIQHAMVLVIVAAAIPLLADEPRVNKEAGRWVEVTTGTINPAKVVKINTDAGSVSGRVVPSEPLSEHHDPGLTVADDRQGQRHVPAGRGDPGQHHRHERRREVHYV